jgi:sRNA-binding regulator protein Hfq
MKASRVLLSFAVLAFVPIATAQERKPLNPFTPANAVRDDSRPGKVILSNGEELTGHVYTTRDKRFRIFDIKDKSRHDIPLAAISTIEVTAEKEVMEKDWRWKEEGSDVKLYTGKEYPWKKYVMTVTLLDGEKITGHLTGLVYIQTDKEVRKFELHDRDKGETGQKLKDIVHIKKVELVNEDEKKDK